MVHKIVTCYVFLLWNGAEMMAVVCGGALWWMGNGPLSLVEAFVKGQQPIITPHETTTPQHNTLDAKAAGHSSGCRACC